MVQKDPNRYEWKMPLERRFLSVSRGIPNSSLFDGTTTQIHCFRDNEWVLPKQPLLRNLFYFYKLAPTGSSLWWGSSSLPGVPVLSNQCVGERHSYAPEAPEWNGYIYRFNLTSTYRSVG